jgi:hypothetical protein
MQETKNAESLFLALVGDIELRQSRVRRVGNWCFFCGASESLVSCRCSFPESFQCVGQQLCSDCRDAHRIVADHIKGMLAAKITDRVTSIRATKFNQLHSAAEVVDEKYGTPFEKQLQFALSQTDPYDDSRTEFRTGILRAFRAARFSDYQTLAKELVREQDRKIKSLLARYYSSCIR